MKALVLGAGAIGSFIIAALAGHDGVDLGTPTAGPRAVMEWSA